MADAGTATLPPEATTALTGAYNAYNVTVSERSGAEERNVAARTLADIVNTGRKQGWPYRHLAEPCGITPERLRQIATQHGGTDTPEATPEFPPYAPVRKAPPRPRQERKHLTAAEARVLRDLAVPASQNTGSRPKGSDYRKASEKFSRLIMRHHDAGIIWEEISNATRPWTTWPLTGDLGDFVAELASLRREQQRATQERNAAARALREAKERRRAASRANRASADEALRSAEARHEEAARNLTDLRARIAKMEKDDPAPPRQASSGIRARAARHGYNKGAPPSIKPYRGVVVSPPPGGRAKSA